MFYFWYAFATSHVFMFLPHVIPTDRCSSFVPFGVFIWSLLCSLLIGLIVESIGPHVKFGIPLVVRSLLICINSGSVYYSVSSFADIRNKLCGPAPVGGDKKHVKLDIKLPPPCLGYPGLTTVTRPHLSNCLLARKGSLQVSLFGPYLDH